MSDNYASVVHQMEEFGVQWRTGVKADLPLTYPTTKRKTCGLKGKWWYWLQEFRPRSGGSYIVGKFGSYKTGEYRKVEIDWKPMSDADKARMAAEHEAARQAEKAAKAEAARIAALGAADLWRLASREGHSPYLERKGVVGEACRYLRDGTVVVPLLRYDVPKEDALRALQRIQPDGFKLFTKGMSKNGCCVRLGEISDTTPLLIACEGYATGLTIRMATAREIPVFVTLDAYNLQFVVEILRRLYPEVFILVAADDDWKTEDHEGPNPGRQKARRVAKTTERCEVVWPAFDPKQRQPKDTDFNDLHQRQGLEAVQRQLGAVIKALRAGLGRRD